MMKTLSEMKSGLHRHQHRELFERTLDDDEIESLIDKGYKGREDLSIKKLNGTQPLFIFLLDKDENVQFRGNADVQLMINGKPTLLKGDALREYIRSLSGQNIENVEIIAQPSARYDASGTAGIININLNAKFCNFFNFFKRDSVWRKDNFRRINTCFNA